MECFDFGEIRKYIERGNKKYTCRTNVPEKIVISIQLLFNTLIDQIGKAANAVTPQDIVDLINDVPEYDFLKPLIPSING